MNWKKLFYNNDPQEGKMDYMILSLVIGLTLFGIFTIFSATMYNSSVNGGSAFSDVFKQGVYAIVGMAAMLFISKIDYKKLKKLAIPALVLAILLLIAVLAVGIEVNGAKRWIRIGSAGTIQPSEFAKMALIFFMAVSLEKKKDLIKSFTYGIVPYFCIILLVCGLIALEPNLSTAAIIAALVIGMMFIGGMDYKYIAILLGLALVGGVAMIIITPWRMTRILTYLHPWDNIQGSGWQVCQSLMALGSGGVFGRGFGNGKAKLMFMPEPQNDFIFSHIGEEMGMVVCIFLLCVYLYLVLRLTILALNAPDSFGMLFCGGMAGLLGLQVFINVGVAIALIPVTGMPLPFVSAGASSMISLMMGMGVVLSISKGRRKHT